MSQSIESEVHKAANELQEQGVVPSVRKIRAVLQHGSHTVVGKHLISWRKVLSDDTTSTSVPESASEIEMLKRELARLEQRVSALERDNNADLSFAERLIASSQGLPSRSERRVDSDSGESEYVFDPDNG